MSILVGQMSFRTSVLWPFTRNTPRSSKIPNAPPAAPVTRLQQRPGHHGGWRATTAPASHVILCATPPAVRRRIVRLPRRIFGRRVRARREPTCPQHCSGWMVRGWQARSAAARGAGALAANTTSVEQPAAMVAAEPPLDEAARHAVVCVCVKAGAAQHAALTHAQSTARAAATVRAARVSAVTAGRARRGERLYHPPPPPPPSPPPPPWSARPLTTAWPRHVRARRGACRPGFEGERCEKVTNACPGGCSGHGRCDAVRGVCVCSLGYAGEDCGRSACATPDDESPHGCHGRGHCECDRATRSCECQCQVGFAPPLCANTTCQADCHSAEGHGVCVRGKCQCNGDINSGWRGADCGVDICPRGCSPPNGRCVDGDCVCKAGWRGRACEISTCPGTKGESVTCSNHGRCDVNHKLDVRCICEPGFKGDDCGTAKNSTAGRIDCARRECSGEDHGSCATDDEPPCICKPGWAGDKCERLLCPASCSGHGFCTDAGCRCYQGWRGGDCASAACVNDCMGHGECHSGTCLCEAGWRIAIVRCRCGNERSRQR